MKKLSLLLLLSMCFTFINSFSVKPIEKKKVEIIFTNYLKYADLATIKQDLLQKGIIIEYKRLEFDKRKNLKLIDFFVDCKDGYSGLASTSKLSKKEKFGFYRDYSEGSATHFFAGFFN